MIQSNEHLKNGRLDFRALCDHYEGVGILAIDITKAEATLRNLHYTGEKPPHMWWEEFEKQLTGAFVAYNKSEQREVHSDGMKLRILLGKIKADFLGNTRAGINIELSKTPMTMTYNTALAAFRNEVNNRHPPRIIPTVPTRRHIRETSQGGRGTGSGRFQRGGRGRGGRTGRRSSSYIPKTKSDSKILILTDGEKIEGHHTFRYPWHVWKKIKPEDKQWLRKQKDEVAANQRTVNELQSQLSQAQSQVSQLQQMQQTMTVPAAVNVDNQSTSQVSQVTNQTRRTMMGGRNEQAALRSEGHRSQNVSGRG